jgi:hypothetical protein
LSFAAATAVVALVCGIINPVDDAIHRYQSACRAKDIPGMVATLTPDAELVSPISGHLVFRGAEDVGILLDAVYAYITDFRWTAALGDGSVRVGIGQGKLGPLPFGDVMVTELADDGQIRRLTPHVRPWLTLSLLAVLLVPKLARHPGVVLRALRGS